MSKLEPARTYSNPTANDILRRLLDERGVEWEDCGNGATYVEHNGEAWRFDYDEPFDQLAIVCLSGYTPEQAIAATLGTETCRNTAPSYLDFLCSECGFVHYHSDENDSGDGNEWHYCPNCGRRCVG